MCPLRSAPTSRASQQTRPRDRRRSSVTCIRFSNHQRHKVIQKDSNACVRLLLIMYLSFVVRIARSKYPATVHQVSSISFARLAVTAMARTHTTEATQATAQVNLRIGTSLAESLHNTTEEDVTASISLKRAYRQGSKPVAGEACYQLGLLHERRAGAALLRILEGDNSG